MKRISRRNFRRGLAAAMTCALLAGTMTGSMVASAEESGGTLNVALTNSFTGASAINTANPYRFATLSQVYETMLSLNNGEYEGILLEDWESAGEGVWNLTLYEGITDSEGNAFTSEDVKWALNKQKEIGHNVSTYYETDCVEVVDDTHFTLTIDDDSEGVFYLICTQLLLCTEEAYENSEDNLATMPVGTGPYVCTSYVEGSSCTLEKRADYWKTENIPNASIANFDTIEISFVTEATQMSIAITGGTVELAGQVDMSISGQVDSADGITAYYTTNGTFNGLAFNMSGRDISDNLALREAICYAIDNAGLVAAVYQGHGEEMTTYGMDTASDYSDTWICNYSEYNLDLAAEKLAEAGYNGEELVLLANNVGEDSQLAELIQGYLAAAGITVVMDYVDPATQSAKLAEGEWDLTLAGGSGILDMSLFWGSLYAVQENGVSKYFHSDEALYEIYDALTAVGGKTEENLQAMYEYEAANLTWYPMFNKQILYAYSDTYTGLTVNDAYMSLPYLGSLS